MERGALESDPERMGYRDLRILPGVGERRALAVLERRRAARPADGPLWWSDVHGIGEATEARIRAWIAAHGGDQEAPFHRPRSDPTDVPSTSQASAIP